MHKSTSHIITMMPFAKRLAKDGHQVHFLETHSNPKPFKYPPDINYTYIRLKEEPNSAHSYLALTWENAPKSLDVGYAWMAGDSALVEILKNHPNQTRKVLDEDWDMVVFDEIFSVTSHALAYKATKNGRPTVYFSTSAPVYITDYYFSTGTSLAIRPAIQHKISTTFDVESFMSRLQAFANGVELSLVVNLFSNYFAQEGIKRLGIEDFSYFGLARDSSLHYIDSLNQLLSPAPTTTDRLDIAYFCDKDEKLPEDYRKFVEDPASKGTILIAFGSNAQWKFAPKRLTGSYFSFNGVPEQLPNLGNHVLLTEWAPQKALLLHNKTVAYVSHGGIKSLKDAVCGGVPVVFMPIFAEQSYNAEMSRAAGFAHVLDKTSATAAQLQTSLRDIIGNKKYRRALHFMFAGL
ncbi:unnamed protein product [Caenorhabditis auriculariae]|uniref:UDP-glucuronosyltransferase n=1 Tax=Caenorhabditis auriculariae TaxID=2777116 RepID=A0A8S1GPX0_9PELO|nr:unnamed protein product [Caenorhabditis auriculariae]